MVDANNLEIWAVENLVIEEMIIEVQSDLIVASLCNYSPVFR